MHRGADEAPSQQTRRAVKNHGYMYDGIVISRSYELMYDKTARLMMASSLSLMVLIAARELPFSETKLPWSQCLDHSAMCATAKNGGHSSTHCSCASEIAAAWLFKPTGHHPATVQKDESQALSLIVQYAARWRWRRLEHTLRPANVVVLLYSLAVPAEGIVCIFHVLSANLPDPREHHVSLHPSSIWMTTCRTMYPLLMTASATAQTVRAFRET